MNSTNSANPKNCPIVELKIMLSRKTTATGIGIKKIRYLIKSGVLVKLIVVDSSSDRIDNTFCAVFCIVRDGKFEDDLLLKRCYIAFDSDGIVAIAPAVSAVKIVHIFVKHLPVFNVRHIGKLLQIETVS